MMKTKIFAAITIVAAVLSLSPARADSIVLYGNSEQPPKAWLDGSTPKGFVIEASIEVLKRAGYDVTVTLLPFARDAESHRRRRHDGRVLVRRAREAL
jgi:flagellar biosynthesis/type III secretory pathway M-ring protein FliF/YscJ